LAIFIAQDQRVRGKVDDEESRLFALGIDLRPTDASKDYDALFRDKSKWDAKRLLAELERTVKEPFLDAGYFERIPQNFDDVFSTLDDLASDCLATGDWATYERVFRVRVRFTGQLLGMTDLSHVYTLHTNAAIMGDTGGSAAIRAWYRKRLESDDLKPMVAGLLAGLARRARLLERDSPTMNTSFRQSLDLKLLTHIRELAEDLMVKRPIEVLGTDLDQRFLNSLRKDRSEAARWWEDRLGQIWSWRYQGPSFIQYRICLITIDIYDSRAKKKPLVPTWSKAYCFDPELSAPIEVQVKKGYLILSASNGSGTWSQETLL